MQKIIPLAFLLNLALFALFLFTHQFMPLPMGIHMLSLGVLWWLVINNLQVRDLLVKKWKEALLVLFLVIIAFMLRIYRVEEITPGMYGDEVTVGLASLALLKNPQWVPFVGSFSHPSPLLYLTAASIQFFGHTMTAVRLQSMVFGALTVGAFYVLIRLFLPLQFAVFGAVLMVFQYTQVILSRLAYEPMASLFFQLITLIFLILSLRKKEKMFLLGVALSLSAGMYTYYNSRLFAATLVFVTFYFFMGRNMKQKWHHMRLFLLSLFIGTMPLISYALIDPQGFWGRINTISIFSRNYTTIEFFKELGGNIYRTGLFPFIGDPNPGKNPSGVTMFDQLTILLALGGSIFLYKKNKSIFLFLLILGIPTFLSDILSTEVIPEFHYYGLGHPNALRVSGLIGIVLFAATFGMYWFYSKLKLRYRTEYIAFFIFVTLGISFWNWDLYFAQSENDPSFYMYNYTYNDQKTIEMVKEINKTRAKTIGMTNVLAENGKVPLFLSPEKKVESFVVDTTNNVLQVIENNDITAIDVTDSTVSVLNQLTSGSLVTDMNYSVQTIKNPLNQPQIVLFEKNTL